MKERSIVVRKSNPLAKELQEKSKTDAIKKIQESTAFVIIALDDNGVSIEGNFSQEDSIEIVLGLTQIMDKVMALKERE